MLVEVRNPRQIEDEGYRRWFTGRYFDLIVWYEEDEHIDGFQLCYDKPGTERALTWRRRSGYIHEKLDDGEIPGRIKMTPILVPDGTFSKDSIAEKFRQAAREIDRQIVDFVHRKILEFD